MPKLAVFNHISLDGFFVDSQGDMRWAKTDSDDAEWNAFVAENSSGGGQLLFGRVTYELMASYWPTSMASSHTPSVAEHMNRLSKVVFSRTLTKADWSNTKLVKGDMLAEVRKMKHEPGEDMVILGSGSIVSQLAQEGLIDEFQIVLNPIILGKGRTLFESVTSKPKLKLAKSRVFQNGNVFLSYELAA